MKIDVVQMRCSIYQMNRIFEENPDLETIFAYLLSSTCYGHINVGGMGKG
jgi:hypothetical protein